MTDVYTFRRGTTPLLVSIPHDGRALMPGQSAAMSDIGRAIPDTDWHVRQLYDFAAGMGASVIAANYSRYVVDLNRAADDSALYQGQLSTGLCPLQTFAGEPLYREMKAVSRDERERRVRIYWQPYHDQIRETLDGLKNEFGYALLWDGHSIKSEMPALFDGALPDLNFGTNDGDSCAAPLLEAVVGAVGGSAYTSVSNGRFKGGYITRHYGSPEDSIHAIQLEIAQKTYMDEVTTEYDGERAAILQDMLGRLLGAYLQSAAEA
ncbi:MAG: N-formylglutamate deformylase [Gammaproteobacteria bacterium]|nr:N-formylglutamate deformylase [Gammaproteobacteria bacterium]